MTIFAIVVCCVRTPNLLFYQTTMNDNIKIQRVRLSELQSFYEREKNKDILPISFQRVQSYIHNPRANHNLPVLYVGYIDDKIVSYRSVFQDSFENNEGKKISIVWISGSWTHPEFRKKGYSRIILDEVSKDYQQRIFISNYGNLSYSLYSKREDLVNFRFLNGQRFYYRFSLAEILSARSQFFSRIKFILSVIDSIGNLFIDFKKLFHNKTQSSNIETAEFNQELNEFIAKHNSNALFKRNIKDFQWIFDFPWVQQADKFTQIDSKYHFTTSAKRFLKKAVTIRKNNKIHGFLLYSIKDQIMNIHYIFCESEIERKEFSNYIYTILQKEKTSTLILTDEKLIELMKKHKGYIYSKHWAKGYFVGKNLLNNYTEINSKEIYMGDGDTIFT